MPDITSIPPPRVSIIDPRTGLMSREWYRWFIAVFNLLGAGQNATSLTDLQVGPAVQTLGEDVDSAVAQAQLSSLVARYDTILAELQQRLDTTPPFPQIGTLAYQNAETVTVGSLTADTATFGGGATLVATSAALTNGAGVAAGTLNNSPVAGNPTKWIAINDNGTTRYIPTW